MLGGEDEHYGLVSSSRRTGRGLNKYRRHGSGYFMQLKLSFMGLRLIELS